MDDPSNERTSDVADDDLASATDAYAGTGIPRWVRIFGVIAFLVVVAFIVLMVAGGGDHGPGRHLRSGDDSTPTSSFTGHTAPAGGHAP